MHGSFANSVIMILARADCFPLADSVTSGLISELQWRPSERPRPKLKVWPKIREDSSQRFLWIVLSGGAAKKAKTDKAPAISKEDFEKHGKPLKITVDGKDFS